MNYCSNLVTLTRVPIKLRQAHHRGKLPQNDAGRAKPVAADQFPLVLAPLQ